MEVCKKNTATAIVIQRSFSDSADMAAMISLCTAVQQAQEAEHIAMSRLDDVVAQSALLTQEANLTNDAAQAQDPNAITGLRPDAGK